MVFSPNLGASASEEVQAKRAYLQAFLAATLGLCAKPISGLECPFVVAFTVRNDFAEHTAKKCKKFAIDGKSR